MKIEDVKVGMWVRHKNGVGRVESVHRPPMLDPYVHVVGLGGGRVNLWPSRLARWEPMAGERVTVPGVMEGVCVVTHVEDWRASVYGAEDGHRYAFNVEGLRPWLSIIDAATRTALYDYGTPNLEHAAAIGREHSAPVRHNSTCPRCKGRAYTGLLHVECAEPECVVVSMEPERVEECPINSSGERGWRAAGRGLSHVHPTRDGAIAAWRKAVGL